MNKQIKQTINIVFKAVGTAMGVAVAVISSMGNMDTSSMISLLGIGVACLGISALSQKTVSKENGETKCIK